MTKNRSARKAKAVTAKKPSDASGKRAIPQRNAPCSAFADGFELLGESSIVPTQTNILREYPGSNNFH